MSNVEHNTWHVIGVRKSEFSLLVTLWNHREQFLKIPMLKTHDPGFDLIVNF